MSVSPEELAAAIEAMKKGPVVKEQEQPDGTRRWTVSRLPKGGGGILVVGDTKKEALKSYGEAFRDHFTKPSGSRGKKP